MKNLNRTSSSFIDINDVDCTMFSDELDEKELDIKLDITKKSRKINRPTCFADQTGGFLKKIFFFKLFVKPAYQAD